MSVSYTHLGWFGAELLVTIFRKGDPDVIRYGTREMCIRDRDMHEAKDNPVLIHPEEDWKALCKVGADNKRNLCATGSEQKGDVDAVMAQCSHVIDRVYHAKANQQAMMETFRTFTYMDVYGRLNVVSSTQIVFHVRRILANALDIPKSKIRVVKPRICLLYTSRCV